MHTLEWRRQVVHVAYGAGILLLHQLHIINEAFLVGVAVGGLIVSLMIKRRKLSPVARMLRFFERDHHMERFPGRGIIFFTLGAALCLLIFRQEIAYGGIAILSVGDAVSNVVGRHFGKIKTALNRNKYIEGNFIGILASLPFAYYFVPNFTAVVMAATVGMFLEIPNIRVFRFEIDDNLIIPLGASFTLTLFV